MQEGGSKVKGNRPRLRDKGSATYEKRLLVLWRKDKKERDRRKRLAGSAAK